MNFVTTNRAKCVMISVQPKWCERIANGDKTIEIRKTRPKIEPPFTCYLYCTKSKKPFIDRGPCVPTDHLYRHYGMIRYNNSGALRMIYEPQKDILNGKVIGEFVCDEIDRMTHCGARNEDIKLRLVNERLYFTDISNEYLSQCQLSYTDITKYASRQDVYGWHISNLMIYDQSKELHEFNRWVDRSKGEKYLEDNLNLRIAPQSWIYVDELD